MIFSFLFFLFFFFFNDTATTEIYTLSLHDALPIHALPLGSTAIRTAPPGIFVHPVPAALRFQMSNPPGTTLVPMIHTEPSAPTPTSEPRPSRSCQVCACAACVVKAT